MQIKFRKATGEDADEILQMEKSVESKIYHAYSTPSEIIENYIKGGGAFMITDEKDRIIGFICYEMMTESLAHVNDLTIKPEYQNQGLGSKGMEFLLDRLKNIPKIELVTHPKNNPAIRLYLKFGFEIEGWKDNFYGDGEPRLILAKVKK